MARINDFFKPVKGFSNSKELDYKQTDALLEASIILSKVLNLSIYVVDYYKKEFAYVSEHPLFLCGYDREKVKTMGYNYFEKIVIAEDLNMLLEINEKGFDFFYNLPINRRTHCFISYDFRVKYKNGNIFLVNHKLVPFHILTSGEMWLAVCLVSLSVNLKPGNVYIQMLNEPVKYIYSFKQKKFNLQDPIILPDNEKTILKLSALGYTSKEIADRLCKDLNTVKFHKSNIFKKLEVRNITEAIDFAVKNAII
ncbi:MAG: response regulator transcription factor [Bacteroidales bacterium]|nr:response regulator transcription factor [Bacteroidales bacterium]